MTNKHDIIIAVDHMTEVVRIAAAGLVKHNPQAALALNGCAVALRKKQDALVHQIMEKLEA